MSVRLWFTLFLCGASLAALIAPHPWTVRMGLVIFFAILAGLAFGRLLFRVGNQRSKASRAERAQGALTRDLPDETDAVGASALLEATMKNMREGMLVVDRGMRVVASNRTAREIFSHVGGALEGKRLSDLTRNPAIHTTFSEAFERNTRTDAKVEMQAAARRTFDLRVVPLHLSGDINTRGAVGVFFDITRLERLERVRQEFLSNVSHELRTPLTAIKAFVETLEDGAIDDSQNSQRFLAVIRRNAERMHNLIDDILELSDIEAGTHRVSPAPVRLAGLVEDVTTALASRARERRVELRNEVSDEVVVFADARRLEQMLTNLIDNAIKFNREQGAVTVRHERIGGSSGNNQNSRDRVSVTDTGDGIPAEHVPRIFERFYRVDRARSRNMGGTGLGLAIVKHLALAHGGEVSVHSTPGQGSTFRIELPVLPEQQQREAAADERAAAAIAASP
jgi:two-component system, OmpR family, phosphate regulon sensor histidine kinase PhoR